MREAAETKGQEIAESLLKSHVFKKFKKSEVNLQFNRRILQEMMDDRNFAANYADSNKYVIS